MRVAIETEAIEQAIAGLRKESVRLLGQRRHDGASALSAFSTVSGFRGVGLRLGRVSSFYSPEALGSLADHCCVGGSHG